MNKNLLSILIWTAVSVLGGVAFALLAINTGETISASWIVIAALCTYAIGYRFYSKFMANKIFGLDDKRATPAEINNDGKDFVPTNKWVLFGHHFAAIAGAGPLVGPILAAQMGYLPGMIWILVGVVLGGAVQDFVILFGSMRRNGKSLGQMAKEEIGPFGGVLALVGVLAIMIILIAVLGMVVVNALFHSPWATFTIVATLPIALFMGVYMRYIRPGRVLEGSLIGFVLLILALIFGQQVADSSFAHYFDYEKTTLAWLMMGYGFVASVLPVWMMLAPRDYLSSFLKVGTILLLAIGILVVRPEIHMPKFTNFLDGSGPVFAGPLFPFLFITIACGAISGFHSLVSSGTTPKMLQRESHARMIGYGGMLMESGVAIMALIAACALTPGVYFAINSPAAVLGADVNTAVLAIQKLGFTVDAATLTQWAKDVGENSILARTGGAPALAVGMAAIFAKFLGGSAMTAFWYHFAILFEAVFILTTIDAGTRIGRFMFQDLFGNIVPALGRTDNFFANILASGLITAGWGYFLYAGVVDPLGGINSLWAMFGISNQMLAGIALTVATTYLLKMGKAKHIWVTVVPLAFLLLTTLTAGWMKIFSTDVKIGFLSHADKYQASLDAGKLLAPAKTTAQMDQIIFNDRLDAVVCGFFMAIVVLIVLDAARVWIKILGGRHTKPLSETPFIQTKNSNLNL
ncbi:carbon starvation CstA family protein [Tumebacillus permanentifrigoris]|uniref:Carbon starvation protein CstA n=1 Tax=Tumebacillus permanentifrigoris TaxID=378543 RepID=A0A316DCT6_9BACL|nr:carbon starvation CstA family protein [Tumebacillus permanentifrigoris]PWK16031.1 carbon starvation protein CstA [Tumebacillus permanentifrigoris]